MFPIAIFGFLLVDRFANTSQFKPNRFLLVVLALCVVNPEYGVKSDFITVFQWSQLEFDYASPAERQNAIDNKTYQPQIIAPIDTDVYYPSNSTAKPTTFVTIPRFQLGSPVTLGVVTDKILNGNPVITPYPSWSWHRNVETCPQNRLVSVFRVMVDECGRLWVLDTGRLLGNLTCPPQILAFDLETNQIIYRYEIPAEQIEPRSALLTPVVDIRDTDGSCTDIFVYMADASTYSIIVYDVQRGSSWRVTDKTMYPCPYYGTYDILGERFEAMDGILGMALEPYREGEDRRLFYHAMTAPTENWVYTSYLRNQSLFKDNPGSSPQIFHTYRGQRRTQSAAEAIDRNGIMFFGLLSDVTVNCWNTRTEYGPWTTEPVSRNRETLQFPSGVKVVTNNGTRQQELYVLTSRFQKIATGTLDTSDVNFRILAQRVDRLVEGTICVNRDGYRRHNWHEHWHWHRW